MSLVSAQVFNRFAANEGLVQDEQAITSRPTSSANFYINSLDKPAGQGSGNFTINKNQNLFNGFFNRIAVNEIVVDWGIPNIATWWGNDTFSVTLSGAIAGTFTVTLTNGFYTVTQILSELVSSLNTATATAGLFEVQSLGFTQALQIDQGVSVTSFVINNGLLARSLFASTSIGATASPLYPVTSPKVLGTTYIDITSENLTYNQKVRDSTTNPLSRDVLYRWYFSYDNVPIPVDADGFPVLQGYDPFITRRTPPVVKQVRWSESQPIGQVAFQVYDDQGRIIDTTNFPSGANFQFQMSCLLSEE